MIDVIAPLASKRKKPGSKAGLFHRLRSKNLPLGSVLPFLFGLVSLLVEMHMFVDVIDPIHRNEMVLAVGCRVGLGQLDEFATLEMVHRADMLAVGTQHFHVILDQARVRILHFSHLGLLSLLTAENS
jgi:hypothetical protein